MAWSALQRNVSSTGSMTLKPLGPSLKAERTKIKGLNLSSEFLSPNTRNEPVISLGPLKRNEEIPRDQASPKGWQGIEPLGWFYPKLVHFVVFNVLVMGSSFSDKSTLSPSMALNSRLLNQPLGSKSSLPNEQVDFTPTLHYSLEAFRDYKVEAIIIIVLLKFNHYPKAMDYELELANFILKTDRFFFP